MAYYSIILNNLFLFPNPRSTFLEATRWNEAPTKCSLYPSGVRLSTLQTFAGACDLLLLF